MTPRLSSKERWRCLGVGLSDEVACFAAFLVSFISRRHERGSGEEGEREGRAERGK